MKKIIGLLMVCTLFGMIFMGCQNAAKGSDPTKFEGKWVYSNEESVLKRKTHLIFTGNSVVQFTEAQKKVDGPFVWSAGMKGPFTDNESDDIINIIPSHGNPSGVTYTTEADAMKAMYEYQAAMIRLYALPYKLNTEVTPNTLEITLYGETLLFKKQ